MRRVVVTGLGAVTPVGNDVNTFWKNLTDGVCGIDFITRFDTSDYKVKIAAEVKGFDPREYMDKSTAHRQDLFSQYAIAAAAQAMADSGLTTGIEAGSAAATVGAGSTDSAAGASAAGAGSMAAAGGTGNADLAAGAACAKPNIKPERLGVYIGSGTGGMTSFFQEAEKLIASGPRKISPFFIPMMIGNMAAGNGAIRFGAQGPTLPVVTACATSTNAIGEAFRAVKHGYADAIIAGGTEATIVPLAVAGFTSCMALTMRNDPKSASIPFDARRDGFVMGEGAGVLILEEYGHAVARGAKIYGEIVGYGNTCDAYHMTAPHPDGLCAARAIRQALCEAGVTVGAENAGSDGCKDAAAEQGSESAAEAGIGGVCESAVYFNAHGTSTPLNDKTETKAIKAALGDAAARGIHVSSTKSMTGHMLGAAGAIEAIATLLALRDGIVPPTVGYEEADPECDLDITPGKSVKADLVLGLSASLGFGGHNGCLAFRKL